MVTCCQCCGYIWSSIWSLSEPWAVKHLSAARVDNRPWNCPWWMARGSNRRRKSGALAWKQGGMWEIVNESPKTKRRKYPQYTSEWGCVIMRKSYRPFIIVYWEYFRRLVFGNSLTKHNKLTSFSFCSDFVLPFFMLKLPISHVCLSPVNGVILKASTLSRTCPNQYMYFIPECLGILGCVGF